MGYSDQKAFCGVCNRELNPAPARYEGENTYVGYVPCPDHPRGQIGVFPNVTPEEQAELDKKELERNNAIYDAVENALSDAGDDGWINIDVFIDQLKENGYLIRPRYSEKRPGE